MTNYNYYEAVKDDIKVFIEEEYSVEDLNDKLNDRNSFLDEIEDILWTTDSVTGGASGSYTFSSYKAEEYLAHNWDLLVDALTDLDGNMNDIKRGPEFCDVMIRCYLMPVVLIEALDELEMDIPSLA